VRQALGVVVVGGLLSSLALTLLLVPVVYVAFTRERAKHALDLPEAPLPAQALP
jgi:Cu/Ag efflux pump CusA